MTDTLEPTVLDSRTIHEVLRGDPWARRPKKGGLTMSGIGVCERKGAYLEAGVPFTEPDSDGHVTASMGNFLHDGLLPRLVQYLQSNGTSAVTEVNVRWQPPSGGAPLRGRLDLATPSDVYDLKTYSEWAFERFVESGPKKPHRWQLRTYAGGRRQEGHPVERIHVIGLERGTGDLHMWSEDFHDHHLEEIDEWLRRVRHHAAGNPDDAIREQRGPGVSKECDWCPFLTRCWGPDAVPGEATVQGPPATDAATESAARLYLEASQRERKAKDDKTWARALLEGAPAGTYGDLALSWRRGYQQKPRVDAEQATDLLRLAGLEVPMKPGPTVAASVIVKAKPEAPA